MAEFIRQRVPRDLDQRTGKLHARGPAADDDEAHAGLALGIVAGRLRKFGALESADDAGADVEGVGQGLEPGCEGRPLVVAEPLIDGAGTDDEVVEGDGRAAVELHGPRRHVDAGHLGLQHREPPALHLLAQHVADGRRHGRRGQARGSDLIQQRLEEVVVGAVDERDLDASPCARAAQDAHSLQATKAAADDDDVRRGHGAGHHRSVRNFQISGKSTTSSILRR